MRPLTEPDLKIFLIRLFGRTSLSLFRMGCEYGFVGTIGKSGCYHYILKFYRRD